MSHLRTRWFLILILLGLVFAGALSMPQVAQAVEFDDDGIITADEMIDDDVIISSEIVVVDGTVNGALIASGAQVTINGNVNGDLVVTGVDVTVNGNVNGNVAFFGQSLTLNGAVKGSVFCIGISLKLDSLAVVGHNVIANGYHLKTEPGSMVGRDVLVSAYQAMFAGRVERDVQADVAALEIEGAVGRDVLADVAAPETGPGPDFAWPGFPVIKDPGLRVSEEARIRGKFMYKSPVDQADAIGADPGGGVAFQLAAPDKSLDMGHRAGQWALIRLRDFITLLVLGSLGVWKYTPLLNRLAEQARNKPLPAIGWGLVTLIGGHAIAVICFGSIIVLGFLLSVVTLGGLALMAFGVGFSGLTLAFILFLLAVFYESKLIVAYLAGKLILQRFAPLVAEQAIWPLVLGVVLYILLRLIPVLGWWIGALVTLIGLGAMWMLFREGRRVPEPVQQ